MKKCCICGNWFDGYGNNPEPVKQSGECCDNCNQTIVIPQRLKIVKAHSRNESEKLNALCKKKVEIVFFDDSVYVGILHKDPDTVNYKCKNLDDEKVVGYYIISLSGSEIHFKKSHVKSIKEV